MKIVSDFCTFTNKCFFAISIAYINAAIVLMLIFFASEKKYQRKFCSKIQDAFIEYSRNISQYF